VLAIAAVLLGGSSAVGVDIDPIAIEATLANATRNDLAGRVTARVGSLPSGDPPFDVVLANLIAGVLVPLAPALHDELRPGGTLLASGIFIDREAEVRSAFESVGLVVGERTAEGDWVALRAERPA
jgi:ribosomal protein L11 methyltransferase